MKSTWGTGILVAVLVSAAAALLGSVSVQGAFSMALLLSGLWTVAAAFAFMDSSDRSYYVGWGIIITGLSLSYFIPIEDAVAAIFIAIVGLIIVTAIRGRSGIKRADAAPGQSPTGTAPS